MSQESTTATSYCQTDDLSHKFLKIVVSSSIDSRTLFSQIELENGVKPQTFSGKTTYFVSQLRTPFLLLLIGTHPVHSFTSFRPHCLSSPLYQHPVDTRLIYILYNRTDELYGVRAIKSIHFNYSKRAYLNQHASGCSRVFPVFHKSQLCLMVQ